jgi:hypothetical protein
MGGEFWRWCILKRLPYENWRGDLFDINPQVESEYQEWVKEAIAYTQQWLVQQNPVEWSLVLDGVHAMELQFTGIVDGRTFQEKIVFPKTLGKDLWVGWQCKQFGIPQDPKMSLGNILIEMVYNKKQLNILLDESWEQDNEFDGDY